MVVDGEPKNFFNGLLDGLHAWIAKFNHFACIGIDEMVVLFGAVRFFKLCHIAPKLMFAHQITGNQKFDGVVKRGPAHTVFLILHLKVQSLDVEMTVVFVNFRENREALRRFSVPVFLQIS